MAPILAVLAVWVWLVAGPAATGAADDTLVLYWGDGCPHCAAEWEFLTELGEEFPELAVAGFEVWHDHANRERFAADMEARGERASAVPTTVFRDRVWVGFDERVETEIHAAVAEAFGGGAQTGGLRLPLLGSIDPSATSLLVITVVIGLVDGLNPCSLWALSVLLALVLRTGSRGRVVVVGLVFLLVTTALYGLYLSGLYGALELAAHGAWIRVVMALVALGFGVVNLKDYWWFKRGVSLAIPERAKPGLYRRMRGVALEERPLPAVLGGTVVLAAGVSLLETPCTAGYPLLWADLLSARGVTVASAVGLFAVYMVVFLADELAVFGTAVVAMRASKLQERQGRALKLVSGVLMVVLAVVLLAAPRLMETVSGALAVFAAAATIAGVIQAVPRWRRSSVRDR
jgi:cytochrome c biogenesis protein CcdA